MMKKRGTFYLIAVLTLILFNGAPTAFAQVLDGAIFELNFSFKGYLLSDSADSIEKRKTTKTGYMVVSYDYDSGGFHNYTYEFWADDDTDAWAIQNTGNLRTMANENYGTVEMGFIIFPGAAKVFYNSLSALIKISKTQGGQLRRASLKSLGVSTVETTISGQGPGGGKISGKTISAGQLPFLLPQ